MRHLFKKTILAAVIVCGNMGILFAQQMPPVPMDAQVRVGKLDNGLTYYIRHNEKPENRVEFHIAQKVGSILEEPQQRGLAHFLEHMAFNGTKNFPGDERGLGIVQWCETKGIKFGVNLNAYTSVDETVYRISNVPSPDASVVDSCLLILHDWSNAILLADKEIDKERGVIREEWRSRNSGMLRRYTEAQPVIYPDSKYSDCMPIGSIDNSTYALNKSYEMPIELPTDIYLLDNISTITVSFDCSNLETKTMNLPSSCVQVVNLPSTYQLTVETDRLMNVTLCGPKGAMETLTPEQVVVEIDAEDFSVATGQQNIACRLYVPSNGKIFALGSYVLQCRIDSN